jgi:hypothetical protein
MTPQTQQTQPRYDGVTDLIPRDFYFIKGIRGEYFNNRLAAEVRARKAFPNETMHEGLARVFHKRFFEEV